MLATLGPSGTWPAVVRGVVGVWSPSRAAGRWSRPRSPRATSFTGGLVRCHSGRPALRTSTRPTTLALHRRLNIMDNSEIRDVRLLAQVSRHGEHWLLSGQVALPPEREVGI